MSFSFPGILILVFGFVLVMNVTRRGRRHRGDWDDNRPGREELADLERRLASVEQLETRVLELENRLDFTERLLTSQSSRQAD